VPDHRLILIRHGETEWNAAGRFTTRTDVALSPAGIAQAAAAASALADVAIDRVIASPLERARITGETIAASQRRGTPPVNTDPRLIEIDAGPFEGLTPGEIEAGPLATAFHRWRSDSDPAWPDGTETYEAAVARATAFFADVRAVPGTTLAATHGSLSRVLVTAVVLGADPALHRRLWLDHCRCAVVELGGDRPRLTGFNVERPDA
jgi:broad specificity phosphatase PhoE